MPAADLFQIKICGVTRAADADAVAVAGADAIGLNFYPQSPRYVTPQQAAEIVRACPPRVQRVGVFVDASVDSIRSAAESLALDWIQLHGQEPPELIQQLSGIAVIRAFRCRAGDLQPVRNYLDRCQTLGGRPQALLLDAWHPRQLGGTGATLDWQQLRAEMAILQGLPWILAGGLRASNVADAIATTGPTGVDTASGVETSPGIKDPAQIANFVQAARQALAATRPGRP